MYHSKTDTLVMTNEPDLPKQKELLKKYSDWGGDIELPDGLPGSVSSPDRFVRLEYYLQYLPEPSTRPISILILADPLCLLPFSCCYRSF